MNKQKEVAYVKSKGKYFLVTNLGENLILNTSAEFNKYIKENNCKILK